MKKTKIHLGVIIAEMTMIVVSLSAFIIFLASLIGRNYIGLFYVVEYLVLGLILSVCSMLSTRLLAYTGNGLIMGISEVTLTGIGLFSSFIMFILFLVDSHFMRKQAKALKEERKQAKTSSKKESEVVYTVEEPTQIEEQPQQEEEVDEVKVRKITKKTSKEEDGEEDKPKREYNAKTYHVSQHPTTNKWQVKLAKGEKALKLFNTQAEALAYAKTVAKKQGGSVRLHSRKGKMRSA